MLSCFDPMHGMLLQAEYTRVVFTLCNVAACAFQRSDRIMQAATAIQARIRPLLLINILADIHAQLPDFTRGGIDFRQGYLFVAAHDPVVARTMVNQPARRMQIGQRVQIGAVMARFVSLRGKRQHCGNQQQRKHEFVD